jgi:hypothetical protein
VPEEAETEISGNPLGSEAEKITIHTIKKTKMLVVLRAIYYS